MFLVFRYVHKQTFCLSEPNHVRHIICPRRFSGKEYRVLVSTTLLERGITVPSVQVIVLRADHPVFTMASLVQIFGRAGRSFDDPKGECLCFAASLSDSMRQSADLLHQMNESVSFV